MHAIAILLFAATLLPQQDGTSVAGRVLDVDGKPAADVEVVLLHCDLPCVADGPEHRLLVRTDKQGMFKAALQPHCAYSASARWPGAVSLIAEGVEAGSFVELRQDPLAAPRQLQVRGLDAYAERAPFQLQCSFGSNNLELLTVPVEAGAATLPALPYRMGQVIELLDLHGEVLWSADASTGEFEVPAPGELQLRVQTADGTPVAGAEIRRHLRNYWYTQDAAVLFMDRFRCLWPVLGVTDANGRLRVRVPQPGNAGAPQDLLMLARKDGLQGSLCGYEQGAAFHEGKVDTEPATAAADAEIVFTLLPSPPPPRTLQLGATLPAAAAPMALRWRLNVTRKNSGSGSPFVEATVTAVDGKLVLPAMPDGSNIEGAWVLLPADLRQQLAERFGCWPQQQYRPLQPRQLLQQGIAQFDADLLQPLAVIAADGRPAERAVVLISPPQANNQQPETARTDRLGRVLVPRGNRISVLTGNGQRSLLLPETASDTAITVELRPLLVRNLRVTDKQGKPLAGVTVRASNFQGQGTADDGELPPADLQTLLSLMPTLRTDADGRARLRYAPSPGLLTLQILAGVPPMPCITAQIAIGGGEALDEFHIEYEPAPK